MTDFKCLEALWRNEECERDNFYLNIEGDRHSFCEGTSFTSSSSTWYQGKKSYAFSENGLLKDVTVTNTETQLRVTQHYRFIEGSAAVRMYNTVTNLSEKPRNVINLSSALISIPTEGDIPWNDETRFKVYTVNSHWATEAQWHVSTLNDFGIVVGRNEGAILPARATLRSEGSWSTGRYYPIVIIEDTEKNTVYFVEHEGCTSWEINFGGEWGKIIIEASSSDIHHDGWHKKLAKGEDYSTTTALVGVTSGGFEEAIKELIKAKRALSKTVWDMKLCYNVFMGGIWGEPTDKNLVPLIKKTAELGCEAFCIDAGWYRKAFSPSTMELLGDYIPDKDRFGSLQLEGILKCMQDSGMVPGLWFEFEAVNKKMQGAKDGEKMLKRNGEVISAPRGFYDMGDDEVRAHLFNAVDRAYKMGMRFIKNDYNFSTGIGYGDGDYADSNRKNMENVYSFIDELLEKYPDLQIENCGSGGMRSDNGTLSHFHVQSTSDQETYYNYPTIAAGSIALMPPEKAGIWVYPYATTDGENKQLLAENEKSQDVLNAVAARYEDTNATVFNMVTGQIGCMYLSGRLDFATGENEGLIKEGIAIFKKNREFIRNAYPFYPVGMSYIGKKGFYCAGLTDDKKTKHKLAVWKIDAKESTYCVDLSKYISSNENVVLVYPQGVSYSLADKRLTVTLKGAPYQAAFFELE